MPISSRPPQEKFSLTSAGTKTAGQVSFAEAQSVQFNISNKNEGPQKLKSGHRVLAEN
jgi:hypothetical protein